MFSAPWLVLSTLHWLWRWRGRPCTILQDKHFVMNLIITLLTNSLPLSFCIILGTPNSNNIIREFNSTFRLRTLRCYVFLLLYCRAEVRRHLHHYEVAGRVSNAVLQTHTQHLPNETVLEWLNKKKEVLITTNKRKTSYLWRERKAIQR